MRHEFGIRIKRAALERSGGVCEAVGVVYGLSPQTRCSAILSTSGVEYDHYPLPAHAEGSNMLENCMAVCPSCHAHKTRHFDIPAEAKIKRVRRKHGAAEDTRKPRPKIRSRPFQRRDPQRTATRPIMKGQTE